jgi:tetratricopeptide (TPR) repeat protein
VRDSSGEADCLFSAGKVYEDLEKYGQAWERYEQALAIYTEPSNPLGRAKSLRGLANVHLARDQVDEAREKYELALGLYEGVEPDLDLPPIYWGRGETCKKGGKPADAIQWMEKAALSYQSVGEIDAARQAQDLASEWRKNDLSSPAAKL